MNPNKALWEKGDFTRIAESMRESGEALVAKLGITKGLKVLDLGCGDGTTAIPAAKLGADVLGVDIAKNLVEAGKGRVNSAHFGAFDYTASFGISGIHPHLQHEACNFARQMMLISLSPLNIRLSDSVTTEMPIATFKGENLIEGQTTENKRAVQTGCRKHFNNVTNSLINGFYQSWDLHPAQLAGRYAAVYSFFLESKDAQAKRLKNFVEKATQAMTTGNQFDDAASAQGLLNFFVRALSCGAMTEAEVLDATSLTAEELRSASFMEIMNNR